MEALHQITRNAVMHRTYEVTNAPVHVYWFNDRIEVLSPGGPIWGGDNRAVWGNRDWSITAIQMLQTRCEPSDLSSVMVLAYPSLKTSWRPRDTRNLNLIFPIVLCGQQ